MKRLVGIELEHPSIRSPILLTQESSSVGARPSSAAPFNQNHPDQNRDALRQKSAPVLGPGLLIDGSGRDDRAPTEDSEVEGKQPIAHKSGSNTPESGPTALITCLPKQGCPCKVTSVSNPALPVTKPVGGHPDVQ